MPSAPLFAFYSVSADAVVMQKPHELFRPRFLPGFAGMAVIAARLDNIHREIIHV